jgi:hypothetical protein
MSKINNIKFEEGILSYTILGKGKNKNVSISIDLNLLNEKIDGFIEYQNKFIAGGFNIVLIVIINDEKRALRVSINPKKEIDVDKQYNMMYKLMELDIGNKIYFPKKDALENGLIKNNDGNYHTISINDYAKYGSVYDYITNSDYKIENKKEKIDEIFRIVKTLINENNIYCYDIKFRNFIVNKDEKVKIIDVEDCFEYDFSKVPDYKLVYEMLIYIQIFHSCPDNLFKYFTSKLEPVKIYTVYTKLYNDDSIYFNENYVRLIRNVLWYYKKILRGIHMIHKILLFLIIFNLYNKVMASNPMK